MDLLWLRISIGVVAFVMMWRTWGDGGMTPASLYWWIGGVALMQLTHLLEPIGDRWLLRREVKAYLSMDPEVRERLLSRVWLSVTREYLREQLAKEPDVEIAQGAEKYPFPTMDRQLVTRLYWALAVVAAALLSSALDLVSLPAGVRLMLICVGGFLLVALGYLRLRGEHLLTVLEITPFAIAEIHPNGSRRVLSFNQPLELRNRPRLGRVELRAEGDQAYIALDYARVGFQRALDRVLTFGGFRQPAA
jgi:hypothetical protein